MLVRQWQNSLPGAWRIRGHGAANPWQASNWHGFTTEPKEFVAESKKVVIHALKSLLSPSITETPTIFTVNAPVLLHPDQAGRL